MYNVYNFVSFALYSAGEVYSFSQTARRTHSNSSLNSGGMFSSGKM